MTDLSDKMLVLGIRAVQILQVMIISRDQFLQESVNFNRNPIPTKSESKSSHLDLSDLTEAFIMNNPIDFKSTMVNKNAFQ